MARLIAFFISLAAALFSAPSAHAQDKGGEFFAGKTIRILVGYAPGGTADADPRAPGRPSGLIFSGPGNGFETYARLLARHLGRFIPGSPKIVVQNMPGVGGLRAASYLAGEAAPDGLTLALLNPANATAPLLAPASAAFDARRLGWIGSMNREVGTCAFWTAGIDRVEDLRKRQVLIGGTGPQAQATIEALVLQALLGFDFRLILGYPSLADIRQPAERREVDGFCGYLVSAMNETARTDLAEGKFRILMQTGLEPHPLLPPDIPNIFDIAPNEEARQVMKVVFGPWAFGKPLAAPPGVPAERIAVLREALKATLADPSFLGEAARGGLEINPVAPEAIEALLAEIYALPAAAIARTRDIIQKGPD
ncbi:MAG: hypothetical protein Q7T55_07500 [Solirubrobacteraceae bacterium]|nr:hypothetical protein [Solirubrobacteraceae bacterium]